VIRPHHTHDKGDLAELSVARDLVKRGYTVFVPLSQNTYADLVVLRKEVLEPIQIKYVTSDNGKLDVSLRRTMTTSSQCKTTYRYKDTPLKWIAVYNPCIDKVCYLPRKVWEGSQRSLTVRIEPTKNKQRKGVILFYDYEDI
jgi:hypothetical protein